MSAIANTPRIGELMERVSDKNLKFGERLNSVRDVMRSAAPSMFAALPKHVTPDRMIRVAMNCIGKNPKLMDCTPISLFSAITEAATYGWELGGVLGHAYLVPFFNTKIQQSECTLIPGYKGLVDLCRRSGQISTISMEVVHHGDKFSYELGDDPHIKHTPNDGDKQRDSKPITHVYVVVKLRDGGVQRSVWSTEKINSHKEQYSKAWDWAENGDPKKGGGKKDSAWHTAWPTMGKKTVLRDMIARGLVPLSAEYREMAQRAIENDEPEAMDFSSAFSIDDVPAPRLENDATETTEGRTSEQQSETDSGQTFRDLMAQCNTDAEAQHVYDTWYGPDSSRESKPGDHERDHAAFQNRIKEIHAARDARAESSSKKGKPKQGSLV